MAQTVMEVLEATARRFALSPAVKHKEAGRWQTTTWQGYRRAVHRAARGLMALGLEAGQCITIIGNNCPQWVVANLGAIYAGGIPAGLYVTSSVEQITYVADHCQAVVAVVEDQEQLAKFKKAWPSLPKLAAVVLMNGSDDDDDRVWSWADLLQLADDIPEDELEGRMAAQQADDVCTLIYTSGTTGPPKGVMLSHDNLTWTGGAAGRTIEACESDQLVSYLPLSHIAEQVVTIYMPMHAGCGVWFAEGMEMLGDNLREVRPTLFVGVPRVWEKIQAKITEAAAQSSPAKKLIGRWARKQGLAGGQAEQNGRMKPLGYCLANALVFSRVRSTLGLDNCRMVATTAAPISMDTLQFFQSLGLNLLELYGMSECSGPGTMSVTGQWRLGWAGRPLRGTEVKLTENNELCLRGRHVFKGYFKDEKATAETLDSDGWLHSGDVAEISEDGFIRITDRLKEIIITAGGKNISPQQIEAKLKAIPGVDQVVVIGERRKYLTALFTLDEIQLPLALERAGSPATDAESATQCKVFRAYVSQHVDAVNQTLSRAESIKRFTLLPRSFAIETGELTHTMKLKRRIIRERFKPEIDEMYPD